MAERKLIVQIVGDDESLRRSFSRSTRGAANFHRDIVSGARRGESALLSEEKALGRFSRGALAAVGVSSELKRALLLGSGSFLTGAFLGEAFRKSIEAAREAQVTTRQLSTQLGNSGKSFSDYRKQIDATNLRLSELSGFNKDELDASLTTILRTTGNVSKALRDNALAADIARARHIGLSQAALVVAKTEAGNTTLLRRQGFQISKNATAEQALAKVRQVVAGQARAGATEAERFGAVLHDTEEIIGTGLLPTLNKYLVSGTHWLAQMNESGELQRDVAKASETLGAAVSGIRSALSPVVAGFKLLGRISGGTKNEVELLATAFVILEARTRLIRWGLITTGIEAVGAASTTAAAEVTTLETRLAALGSGAPIVVPIILATQTKTGRRELRSEQSSSTAFLDDLLHGDITKSSGWRKFLHDSSRLLFGAPLSSPVRSAFTGGQNAFGAGGSLNAASILTQGRDLTAGATGSALAARRRGLSLQGRFNVDELRLANAELTKTTADNTRILRDEAAITREQIAGTKNLKDKTTLTNQLVGIMGQLKGAAKAASDSFTLPGRFDLAQARAAATRITSDDLDAARARQAFLTQVIGRGRLRGKALVDAYNQLASVNDQILSAEQTARQQIQEAAQRRTQRLSARQFRALGLDATGSPLTPGVKALRRELGTVDQAIIGTFLDTSKTQSVLSRIRRVLSGGLGAVTKDVRSQVKAMLDDLDQQLKDHAGGPQTRAQKVDTSAFLKRLGLNLTPDEIRRARAELSQLTTRGTVPDRARAAAGSVGAGGRGGDIVNHVHVAIDGKEIAPTITRHQQKAQRRNPGQRRGPHAGQ